MFRRRWSGLPADPVFGSNLKDLGYFINDEDEIRNIDEPNAYFKYFLSKNTRVNDRQRFHFNGKFRPYLQPWRTISNLKTGAIRDIVHGRLEKEGLKKVPLPLGTPATSPHVPIFFGDNLHRASRVVVIFGEPNQDLGNLALRVVNGPGGINKGSMVSVVQELKRQAASAGDPSPPGIIITNPGELWWWPEGKKPLGPVSENAVPMKSMVHYGRAHIPKLNSVPKNETPIAHVRHLLDDVLKEIVPEAARVDIIAIGLSADNVTRALDNPETWDRLGPRINTLSLLGSSTNVNELSHTPFKEFLPRRARAYIADEAVAMTPLAKAGGNDHNASFTQHGCPVFASGEVYYIELMLVNNQLPILNWLQQVALAGLDYHHPEITPVDPHVPTDEEWAAITSAFDAAWEAMPDFAKPSLGYAEIKEVEEQRNALEDLQLYAAEQAEK
ncbi:hypothetical protein CTRI78_v003999 [Colletotrichum trifolii]|uniref:Arb2 domain-containing protein n=1 Tax=Colletotrichum trifolii TaxID=5466 RepID=A0A4R8RQI9_COLTR|nr:hypothetical protein CTRI78_v003999 [Colletotrichum trifolii]